VYLKLTTKTALVTLPCEAQHGAAHESRLGIAHGCGGRKSRSVLYRKRHS